MVYDGHGGKLANDDIHNVEESHLIEQKEWSKRVCGITWNKKRILICLISSVLFIVTFVLLFVFVIGPKVAQASMNDSSLVLGATKITNPTEDMFQLSGTGRVENAGFLDATLSFPDPVQVYWVKDEEQLVLGTVTLDPISVSGSTPKSGDIKMDTPFLVTNKANMAAFSDYMIHGNEFAWRLSGAASASALGLTFTGLSMDKTVKIAGFGGLKDVNILKFNAVQGPNNTVAVDVTSEIINPSNITIEMGDLYFDFKMGTGAGTMSVKNVVMASGKNALNMIGSMPATGSSLDETIKAAVGSSNVISISVRGNHVSTKGTVISWLNAGFVTLELKISRDMTSIAQEAITNSKLSLSSSSITETTENTFRLQSEGQVVDAGFMDASMVFPEDVSVFWTQRPGSAPDVLLGKVSLPILSVSGESPTGKFGKISMDTTFKIADANVMAEFSSYMINGESFSWLLKGQAQALAYGLTFQNLSLSKVITMNGFNGLQNPSVTSFDLPTSDNDGIVVLTGTGVNNPSTITIQMGDLFFQMWYGDLVIGHLNVENVVMVPGHNTMDLRGHMVNENFNSLSEIFTSFLGGNGLTVTVQGERVLSNGVEVEWFNKAFKGLKLTVTVPSPDISSPLVSNIEIPKMTVSMIPEDQSGYSIMTSADLVKTKFHAPYPFPISITEVIQNLNFVDKKSGIPFASVSIPTESAESNQGLGTLRTQFHNVKMSCVSGQEHLFSDFFTALTFGSFYTVGLVGSASGKADTAAGGALIDGLKIDDSLTLSGFQGLSDVKVISNNVIGGDSNGVQLKVGIIMNNPSSVTFNINGDVKMNVFYKGQGIGTIVMPNMRLATGQNQITAYSTVYAASDNVAGTAAVKEVMSSYLMGYDASVEIKGSSDSIGYASLKPAFSQLKIQSSIPGQQNKLMNRAFIRLKVDFEPIRIIVDLVNTLDSDITMVKAEAEIWYQGTLIGTIDHTFSSPLHVGAGEQAYTEDLVLVPKIGLAAIRATFDTLKDHVLVDVKQKLVVGVGSYYSSVNYNQDQLPVYYGRPH